MERIDLLKILGGNVDHINKININDSALFEVTIPVMPKNVEKMLLAYLSGDLSAVDLSKWANFLCVRSEFTCSDYKDDNVANYYENMWYVIQRLATPEIDCEICKKQVELYLNEIRDKYTNES